MKTLGTVTNKGQIQYMKNMNRGYGNPVLCSYWYCSSELSYQQQEGRNAPLKEENTITKRQESFNSTFNHRSKNV